MAAMTLRALHDGFNLRASHEQAAFLGGTAQYDMEQKYEEFVEFFSK